MCFHCKCLCKCKTVQCHLQNLHVFYVVLLQPDDHGFLGDVPVLRVTRQGPDALHFVASPLEVGQEVHVKVDWERRFDHMQQHSGNNHHTDRKKTPSHILFYLLPKQWLFSSWLLGQHLITALADTMFGYKTTSWYFSTAYVIFPVATKPCRFTDFLGFYQGTGSSKKHHWAGHSLCETWPASGTGRMCKWEDQSSHSGHGSASLYRWPSCGEGSDIVLTGCKKRPVDLCWVYYIICICTNQVRSRGLPEDHAGPIRIIDIEGIDANMCCGTHVSNLGHLQV